MVSIHRDRVTYLQSENGNPCALVFQIESQYTWQPWFLYVKFIFCLSDGMGWDGMRCGGAVFSYLSLRRVGLVFALRVEKQTTHFIAKESDGKERITFLGDSDSSNPVSLFV